MTSRSAMLQHSLRRHAIGGAVLVVILLGGVLGWAAVTEFSGAVIAGGQLVVDQNTKKIQHPTGGVVSELLVREGSRVKAGDVLIRLDDVQIKANLAIVTKSLDEFLARQARFEAERDDADVIAFPASLMNRFNEVGVVRILSGETKLFESRRNGRNERKAQLNERISQLNEEIAGLQARMVAKDKETVWITKELEGVRQLWSQNLVQITRLTALEREGAKSEGETGALIAQIAQTKGRISEVKSQILQVDEDLRAEVGRELSELRTKIAELAERRVAAEDQLFRVDIRSPRDGVVHQLDMHTIGGVVTAGQPIMTIVPEAEALKVDGKVQPQDIDQLYIGQSALVRFTAFNQRTTPELNGRISLISADVSQDQKSGLNYYTIRVEIDETEYLRFGNRHLAAGMPVEIYAQTQPRTVLSFLMRSLVDQIGRTFREK